MDNTELQTPKNKLRSLGLSRRSTQKGNIAKTPISDVKISYKSLQTEPEISSPITPRLSQALASTTYSSNCLPYRLSLSRRSREKYKKKKLEFVANHQVPENLQNPDVQQEITSKEKLLQQHRKHQAKVKELENVIAIWKEAFKNSLEELSSKIEPKMETEDLIARLGIPPDMIDYT